MENRADDHKDDINMSSHLASLKDFNVFKY
jgi:hypothetical protein